MRKLNSLGIEISLPSLKLIHMREMLLFIIPFLALSCESDSLNKESYLDEIEILLLKVDRDSIEPQKLNNLSKINGFRGLHLGLNYDSLSYDTNSWVTNVNFLDDSIIAISGEREIPFGEGKEDIDVSLIFFEKGLVGISLGFKSVFFEDLVKVYDFPNIHNDFRAADDSTGIEIIRIGRSDVREKVEYVNESSKPAKKEMKNDKHAIWQYDNIKLTYRRIHYDYPNEGMNKIPANEEFRASLPSISLFIESVREMNQVREILKIRAVEKSEKEVIEEQKERIGDF